MDLAKSLIRSVVRAFYETKHILIVDALLVHSAVRDDDLAHLLGLQTKELRKLCAKLEEQRLLAVHNRQETREGMQRPISRTYYYIDFRQTIDAIKYRIYRVTKEVESLIRPTDEKKDYFCPRCKSRWTQLEVLDYIGVDGFYCNKCDGLLEREDETIADRGGHEMQSKLMKQLEPLLVLLPRIDEVVIPDNDFEIAFNARLPVQRNQLTNPLAPTYPVGPSTDGSSTTVKGMTQTTAQRIEVDLTSNEAKSAAQQAAEAERKARLAEQNALPVWHTNSTVTGEFTALGSKEEAARREREQVMGLRAEEDEDKKAAEAEMNDDVAEYYAQLARDQQKAKEEEAAWENEEEGEEEDDDDDENDDDEEGDFEDVPTTALALPNGVGNGFMPGNVTPSPNEIHDGDGDGDGDEAGANGQSPSKRRRTAADDDDVAASASGLAGRTAQVNATAAAGHDDEDEDDEEIEFEDVG